MDRSQDWLKQAERDFHAAEVNRAAGLHEWAAFAAQQCAEKAVKALIQALHGAARGLSVGGLMRQLPANLPPDAGIMDAAHELDQVYVAARYPNGFAEGSRSEHFGETSSRRLIEHARTVLEFCRRNIH